MTAPDTPSDTTNSASSASTYAARAKLNLGLAVLGKRDDGFHDIDSLMVRLNLADTLTLTPTDAGIQLTVHGDTAAGVPSDASNLAHKAAQLYLDAADVAAGVAIDIHKKIPVAAGLGGGSADAAAVLHGLAELYPTGLDLFPLAMQLGSDVGFFVLDVPAARARGRGEMLERVYLPNLHFVLVNPGVAVSAKEAYKAVEAYSDELDVRGITAGLTSGQVPDFPNDLEPGIVRTYPQIAEVLAALADTDLQGVRMTGSGSTCFGIADDAAHAQKIVDALVEAYADWWVQAARSE
ncbi:MAG: 4-(cytidine 5'-diphospho)-2-C-methyl-D-erythritol kinase [Deinococcota bacterium]